MDNLAALVIFSSASDMSERSRCNRVPNVVRPSTIVTPPSFLLNLNTIDIMQMCLCSNCRNHSLEELHQAPETDSLVWHKVFS